VLLDRKTLAHSVHEQIGKLIFGKYQAGAVGTDVHGLWEKRGMTTLEFMGHFALLNDVFNKWEPREIPDSHIPVLAVTPFSLVSAEYQVGHLEYEGKKSVPFGIKEELIRNLEVGIPVEPYLLIDIEDGRERINHATEASEQLIKERGRHALTVNEGVALVAQIPEVLKGEYILELAGSRYGVRAVPKFARAGNHDAWPPSEPIGVPFSETQLEPGIDRPILFVEENGQPRLGVYHPDEENNFYDINWGVPSCAERIDPKKY
jgi:hypothetical protein